MTLTLVRLQRANQTAVNFYQHEVLATAAPVGRLYPSTALQPRAREPQTLKRDIHSAACFEQ